MYNENNIDILYFFQINSIIKFLNKTLVLWFLWYNEGIGIILTIKS